MNYDPAKYFEAFVNFVPEYCTDKNRRLIGPPEEWQSMIISYSLYLGLGIVQLDRELEKKLLAGMSQGVRQTGDLVLKGIDEVKMASAANPGEKWDHAVAFLSNFMSLTSSETTGPNANEEIVKRRAPISGLVPALLLSAEDPNFALALFKDAVDEQRKCDVDELSDRINFMKMIMARTMEKL